MAAGDSVGYKPAPFCVSGVSPLSDRVNVRCALGGGNDTAAGGGAAAGGTVAGFGGAAIGAGDAAAGGGAGAGVCSTGTGRMVKWSGWRGVVRISVAATDTAPMATPAIAAGMTRPSSRGRATGLPSS